MKTYYVTRTCKEVTKVKQGCYVEAENPEDARRTARDDGDWEEEKCLDVVSCDPYDDSYQVIEEGGQG